MDLVAHHCNGPRPVQIPSPRSGPSPPRPGVAPGRRRTSTPAPAARSRCVRADLPAVRHGLRPRPPAGSVGRRGPVRAAGSTGHPGSSRQAGRRRKAAGSVAFPAARSSRRPWASRKTDVPPPSPPASTILFPARPEPTPHPPASARTDLGRHLTPIAVKRPPLVAPEQWGILDNKSSSPTSGGLGVEAGKEESGGRKQLGKRRRGGSPVQAAASDESSTARSRQRPAQLRMDHSQSNVGDGSQGQFSGGNIGAYQPSWNPYMFGYQGTAAWFPQGFQPGPLNGPMMNPSGYAPEGFQQTQIPQPAVHQFEPDVEEVPAPTSSKRGKKSTSRTKLANFNADEDKNLVKSWLEISCDPIQGNGQKRERMWQRIIEQYNSRRQSNPERTLRSLQSRWDTIRTEVTLFASYYANTIRENPSGMSDADKTTHAVSVFADVQKRKFGLLHCWELMKDAPKWQDPIARDLAAAAQGEGFGEDNTADHSIPVTPRKCKNFH